MYSSNPLVQLCTLLLTLFISIGTVNAFTYPVKGDVKPNDKRLYLEIPESSDSEISIVSFNVRNLGARSRSIKDFAGLLDLVDEADVIFLQEVGLGLITKETMTASQEKALNSVAKLIEINLGKNWTVKLADGASGVNQGRETSLVAYRHNPGGYALSVNWKKYVDLGSSRDLAEWEITIKKEDNTKTISVGSVHLTPNDPARGLEMKKVGDWLISKGTTDAIALGDMNWGYRRTSGVENYTGEAYIDNLDNSGKLYHLFKQLSYLKKGKETDLRTNMGFRKDAFFYDQFLLSPSLASDMANEGKLLKDCGMIAFGKYDKYTKDKIKKIDKNRINGLEKYAKATNLDKNNNHYKKTLAKVKMQSNDSATYYLSDHRPIWMVLNVW